jgi:hypothetical protein
VCLVCSAQRCFGTQGAIAAAQAPGHSQSDCTRHHAPGHGCMADAAVIPSEWLVATCVCAWLQIMGTNGHKGMARSIMYEQANNALSLEGDTSNTLSSIHADKEWQHTKRSIGKSVAVAPLRCGPSPAKIAWQLVQALGQLPQPEHS